MVRRKREVALGPLPTWKRQLPLATVLIVMTVGLGVLTGVPTYYRGALCIVAASLVVAAVARIILPVRRVGLLAARSRPFDVLALLAVAVAIVILALSLPPPAGMS